MSKHRLFLLLCCLAAAPLGRAETASGLPTDKAIELFVQGAAGAAAVGRVEITVGQLDSRIRLAPCQRMEPYVPPGVRLWGRSYVGVRCTEGARWNVMMPVTVKVYGKALIAATALPAGAPIGEHDVQEQEVELTRDPIPPLTDVSQLAGKVVARNLMPGQPVRMDYLRVPPTVAAGDPVKIELVGTGFSIGASGQAMSAGGEGQSVRVRTDAGRVLSGVIRNGRTVEVRI